jgi:hypothetical protein
MTLKRFKKSCSFFFSTQVKLTNYLLNLEITHIFFRGGEKIADAKTASACQIQQRQQTAFSD